MRDSGQARRPVHVRVFRLLLRVLPAEFRGDFGDDMQADFAEQYRDARDASRATAAAVWLRTVPDLLQTALRQHGDALVSDVRFALRLMWRTPAFTAVALLMIAL